MQRKLAGYVFLSLFSFGVFTTLFYTVANAQTTELMIPVPSLTPNNISEERNQQTQSIQQPQPTSLPSTVQFTLQTVQPTPTSNPVPTNPTVPAPTKAVSTPTATPTTQTIEKTILAATAPTPTAIPQPQPTITVAEDLEAFFTKYASEYSVDKEDLKRIARCESGFNSQADTGLYAGMYQYHAQTWASTRNAMGLDPNPDLRKNAEESIKTSAFKIKNGGRGAWPNC